MVRHLARLHGALNARTNALLAQNANQIPPALRDLRDLGDRLHLLNATYANFGDP